jgi:hypothetical protein
MAVLPQRPADLDACAFPEAHGQTATLGTADLAASTELAGDVREPDGSEIAGRLRGQDNRVRDDFLLFDLFRGW